MEMAYRERWWAEIAKLQRILSGFDLREEWRWGKPCYTLEGKNVVIIQQRALKEAQRAIFFEAPDTKRRSSTPGLISDR